MLGRAGFRDGLLTIFATALIGGVAMAAEPPAGRAATSKAKPVTKAVDDGDLIVIPKSSAPVSEFLKRPKTDRYDTSNRDWSEIPEWRQASFFGVRAEGTFFIYVVDCSGSMIEDDRLSRAKDELRKSVARLKEPQRFQVIFYNDAPLPMPGEPSFSANLPSKDRFRRWLSMIEPDGGTDPRSSLGLALAYRPDGVFLLSDGEYPDGTVEAIRKKNPNKIPIHCIDLSGGAAGDQLKRIAADSGGQYASRPSPMR